MFKKLALLAAALTLTVPAFAQGTTATPAASAPAASSTDAKPAKKHHSTKHKKSKDTTKDASAPK
jgi:hypothetical protein